MLIATAVVTPPATEPVSLAEAKLAARVDHDAEDTLISALITAARQHVEKVTGRAIITQTWKAYFPEWPSGDAILLPKAPLVSVTHVKYTDSAAVTTTWDSANYTADTASEPGRIVRKYGVDWPSATLANDRPIEVQFICGAATANERIKQAIKFLVAWWLQQREAVVISHVGSAITAVSAPLAFDSLISEEICELGL